MIEYINTFNTIALMSYSIPDLSVYVNIETHRFHFLTAIVFDEQQGAYRRFEKMHGPGSSGRLDVSTISATVKEINDLPVLSRIFPKKLNLLPTIADGEVPDAKHMLDIVAHALTAMVKLDGPRMQKYRTHTQERCDIFKAIRHTHLELTERSAAEIFAPHDTNLTQDWGEWA